jgi:hypothetical protein
MKIHGLACFQTSDGLKAYGSGRLKFASKHTPLFEFRDPMRGGSDYLSSNIPTVFVRKFYYRGLLAHLVGVLKKTRDRTGRVGFWGVSAMVDDDKPINVEIVDYLFGIAEFADQETIEGREACFQEVLGEHDNFPPGELEEYEERDSLVFSIQSGILSDEILHRSKSLMEVEPSSYSTLIVQLGNVATPNLGELNQEKFAEYYDLLTEQASHIQAEIDFENLAPHIKKFIERTDKIGVPRPEIVDAEFENYLIALIRYVNSSISQKQRR